MDSRRSPEVEIAHILFMDIVGYTLLPLEGQARVVRQLQDVVRGTSEFARAEAQRELIRLPAGDGMALVFLRDPLAPLRCAIEIARAVRALPDLPLRMGVHSGPVSRGEDINAAPNVAGGGVNIARRVMDCGDAGHILLSYNAADIVAQLGAWEGCIHDLGEFEVKHGARLRLFNFVDGEVGNAASPRVETRGQGDKETRGQGDKGSEERRTSVALLYKRDAEPDEHLLALLETRLKADGHRVFIDRHLTIGVEWAREIEREIREADAVVPLL